MQFAVDAAEGGFGPDFFFIGMVVQGCYDEEPHAVSNYVWRRLEWSIPAAASALIEGRTLTPIQGQVRAPSVTTTVGTPQGSIIGPALTNALLLPPAQAIHMLLGDRHPTFTTGPAYYFVDDPIFMPTSRLDLHAATSTFMEYLLACGMRPAASKMWFASTAGTASPLFAYDKDKWFEVRQMHGNVEHLGATISLGGPAPGLLSLRDQATVFEQWIAHCCLQFDQAIQLWNHVVLPAYCYMAITTYRPRMLLRSSPEGAGMQCGGFSTYRPRAPCVTSWPHRHVVVGDYTLLNSRTRSQCCVTSRGFYKLSTRTLGRSPLSTSPPQLGQWAAAPDSSSNNTRL